MYTPHSTMSCPDHTYISFKPSFLHVRNIPPTHPTIYKLSHLNLHQIAITRSARNHNYAQIKLQHEADANRTLLQAKLYKIHRPNKEKITKKLVPYYLYVDISVNPTMIHVFVHSRIHRAVQRRWYESFSS